MTRTGRDGLGAILALTAATLTLWAPGEPVLLILAPLGLLLLALPPFRVGRAVAGVAVLALALVGAGQGAFPLLIRGWALLVGAWFVLLVLLLPRSPFLSRALGAVAGAFVSAALLLSLRRGGWAAADWTVGRQFYDAVAAVVSVWRGAGLEAVTELAADFSRAAELQALLHPALLGLASVSGLAIAWSLARRGADGLRPLREFRFRDELVWLLIAGIVLMVLPLSSPALVRAGANLMAFMGALYALRGVAVLLAVLGTPGVGGVFLAALATLLIPPLVMVATVLVGLTDTWLDLRARRASLGPNA
ncbi:MAG: hypothetical protein IRZ00_00155 [Gemmatimonadetes bacterium]|nr:hypothetical protein [Gemmatimonadota bacterium]